MKKQLFIFCDMEGASGIFYENRNALHHGSFEWENEGRYKITSDVLAVCEAAIEFGIDEILIYDGHNAGETKTNIIIERLPSNVKLVDVKDRLLEWRRIRGQASEDLYGIITVGQHARYDEESAYFPHSIQSPPIKKITVNGLNIAEIGMAVLNFQGTKYLANIGCQASMREALELSSKIVAIPVKDKETNWEPTCEQTYGIIKAGVKKALENVDKAEAIILEAPYKFSMELVEGYEYKEPNHISWKGTFLKNLAYWEAPSVEIGFELLWHVREYIFKQ